nr:hypothetical protein BdHM001_36150 [Bdellovibrio sp. HM001]
MNRAKFWEDLNLPHPNCEGSDSEMIRAMRDKINHALDLLEEAEAKLNRCDFTRNLPVKIDVTADRQ